MPTRKGRAVESLWCNFPLPSQFHDTRFVGSDYRERERIKRKIGRWVRRLRCMPAQERAAIMAALGDTKVSHTTVSDDPAVRGRDTAPKVTVTAAQLDIFGEHG